RELTFDEQHVSLSRGRPNHAPVAPGVRGGLSAAGGEPGERGFAGVFAVVGVPHGGFAPFFSPKNPPKKTPRVRRLARAGGETGGRSSPRSIRAAVTAPPSGGRALALLDRHAPVYAVFVRRIVACRLVVRAAVVPDDDVALAPFVGVRGLGLDHVASQLLD